MALTDDGNMVLPVQPMNTGYGNNGFGGFGGDLGWIIIFLLFGMFNGWGGGFGGGFGADGLYPWLNNSQNINGGFRDQMLTSQLQGIQNGITSGFGDVQTALCGGFAGVNAGIAAAQNGLTQQMYMNQISDLERSFAAQTASTQGMTALQAQLAQCCCDNRAATADVKYTIATEACQSRATSTANTQAILDKLCQLELDNYKNQVEAKNDQINQLRSQLQFANMQASQVDQTAQLRAAQATTANQLVSELRSCPIPSQPVYGNQPIFTCNQNQGCGCGCGM